MTNLLLVDLGFRGLRRSRVLAKNKELRKLFWLGEESDGSIYAESYFSPKQYKTGSFTVPHGGNVHVSYSEGSFRLFNQETKVKASFHPSGETHVKTRRKKNLGGGKRLLLIKGEKLESIRDYKKLITILPKETTCYPIMDKKPSIGDAIVPIQIFYDNPFVVEIYLTKKSFDLKRLISPKMVCCWLVNWENRMQLVSLAYQTEDMRKTDKFPPYEYWLFSN